MFEHRDVLDPSGVRNQIQEIFSERSTVGRVLRFEAAIAFVEARRGLVPSDAAQHILARARSQFVSSDAIERKLHEVGHPMVAILEAWAEQLRPDAAEWIHYGATTADVLRTVQFMQLLDTVNLLDAAMRDIELLLADLAARHRETPMIGRTLGRHALPITFGFKICVWLCELRRDLARLHTWRNTARGGVFSGALGTYAMLGPQGPSIEAEVLAELDLAPADWIDVKGSADRYAELAAVLAITAKSYGRIAQEIFLLQGDDIRELGERSSAVGSSTMPHKSNPNLCIEIVSKSREVAAMLPVMLDWMIVVHERDSAHHDSALVRICVEFGQLVSCMDALLRHLEVFPDNMLRNLERTHGLVYAEALTRRLAPLIGRRSAHAALHELAQKATRSGRSLFDLVQEDETLRTALEPKDFAAAQGDFGLAPQIVERVLGDLGLDEVLHAEGSVPPTTAA